jgi:cobalt-zinc-cadmium efflux system membrane fusion protein
MIANVIETDAPAYKVKQEVEVSTGLSGPRLQGTRHNGRGDDRSDDFDNWFVPKSTTPNIAAIRDVASSLIHVGEPIRSLAVPANRIVREETEQ